MKGKSLNNTFKIGALELAITIQDWEFGMMVVPGNVSFQYSPKKVLWITRKEMGYKAKDIMMIEYNLRFILVTVDCSASDISKPT